VARATLDKRPAEIAAMFDAVAEGYDRTNDVLSFGQDRLWRRATARAVAVRPGERLLDLATGTGTSIEPFDRGGARAVGCDLSMGMLRVGRARNPSLRLVAGDALALPFADASFDALTVSFGLRNVTDLDAALVELRRVARPGGRLVVCELSQPTWAPFRFVYTEYLMRALPLIAERVASDGTAYRYLVESVRAWPDQCALADRLATAGWVDVRWRNLTGGIAALHTAARPDETEA
jgi:demethylmenaquinone methyltransferase/2-methoxy-6-polyprenyl-1,4-benzoquinol methylase